MRTSNGNEARSGRLVLLWNTRRPAELLLPLQRSRRRSDGSSPRRPNERRRASLSRRASTPSCARVAAGRARQSRRTGAPSVVLGGERPMMIRWRTMTADHQPAAAAKAEDDAVDGHTPPRRHRAPATTTPQARCAPRGARTGACSCSSFTASCGTCACRRRSSRTTCAASSARRRSSRTVRQPITRRRATSSTPRAGTGSKCATTSPRSPTSLQMPSSSPASSSAAARRAVGARSAVRAPTRGASSTTPGAPPPGTPRARTTRPRSSWTSTSSRTTSPPSRTRTAGSSTSSTSSPTSSTRAWSSSTTGSSTRRPRRVPTTITKMVTGRRSSPLRIASAVPRRSRRPRRRRRSSIGV
mmetsp:Transcript_11884/g.47921  ORF Transcript_11884/g.47921 Transcript_11884/m.47921 type:complete len:357 (-) Transcript_11884:626-1696(-)